MTKTFEAHIDIPISATIDQVWEALITPRIVRQYLHGTRLKTDWKVGGPITWSGQWQGKAYVDKGTVLEFKPKTRISTSHFSPLSGLKDLPKNYHIVNYDLSEKDDYTLLTLTQSNCPTKEAAVRIAEEGWRPIMNRLKELLET